jgi:hypothetical protein
MTPKIPSLKSLAKQVKSRYWRIIIPNLLEYKNSTSQQLHQLKCSVLQRLIAKETKRGLQYYRIALEHHVNGVPHLDILITYLVSKTRRLTDWDHLLRHGNVTKYRQLNTAIIDYGTKEDKFSLSNFPEVTSAILQVQALQQNPFLYLYRKMKLNPLHFNLQQYVESHELAPYIKNWGAIKVKIKDMQEAAANISLKSRPGIQLITRALVQERLTPAQLQVYDSWPGYQTIVDHLNIMTSQKGDRQQKSLNLLITGAPNTGKSALVWQRNPPQGFQSLLQHCSVYPMGMAHWFPKYHFDVYHAIYWNQARLTAYSYDTILKILDGSPLDLPSKGGQSRKVDNPLVIMTSNMTLQQMILQKFNYNRGYLAMARENLSVRLTNVVVPQGLTLFLLQKLLVSG